EVSMTSHRPWTSGANPHRLALEPRVQMLEPVAQLLAVGALGLRQQLGALVQPRAQVLDLCLLPGLELREGHVVGAAHDQLGLLLGDPQLPAGLAPQVRTELDRELGRRARLDVIERAAATAATLDRTQRQLGSQRMITVLAA